MDKGKASIIAAAIGAIALIIVATITFWKDWTISQLPISATQTAEARLTQIALITSMPSSTPINFKTPTTTSQLATPTLGIGSSKISPIDGATMMLVPAGEFTMGSSDRDLVNVTKMCSNCERSWFDVEQPQLKVYLDAFWVDKFEVTNKQYRNCVEARKCQWPSLPSYYQRKSYFVDSQFDNYPVIYLSWNDAKIFCEWAEKRLLTEAEWEKSARGNDARVFPWGNTFDTKKYNSFGSGLDDTAQVGSNPDSASPYGVMDLAGNVWEWVSDWYDTNYYTNSPKNNPTGPLTGQWRVLRGGSWRADVAYMRTTFRQPNPPDNRGIDIGARCAKSYSP